MPNRLAQSQSLYLRKHADNPIDWNPWDDVALARAKQENKPIFLSIGYSSCHWCTVMEGEAFSNEAIATYMNEYYVPIKVDREERPDIDSIYMQTLQLLTGQGGWPLNVFLAPDDLVPFYGGTYFPIDPKYGRPGFLQVLQTLQAFYHTEDAKVQSVKSELRNRLRQMAAIAGDAVLTNTVLAKGLNYSAGILSSRGTGNSFPMIPYALTALRATRLGANSLMAEPSESASQSPSELPYNALEMTQKRGLDLALGGIFDHVAGGFHRYTVDPTWTVPHFEKMLYDNGQIVEYLAELWAAGVQDPAFERAIAFTCRWLQREMVAPQGYFYAAQDADSFVAATDLEPEEGAFYVWNYTELAQALNSVELAELVVQFTVTKTGNFEGKTVLQRQQPGRLSDSLEQSLSHLFALRYGQADLDRFPPARNNHEAKTLDWPGRIPAVTDPKMILAWNSLMISGLARAATVFRRSDYLEQAVKVATFILEHQFIEGRLQRLNYEGTPAVIAQSEDYALWIKALLDLQQATLSCGAIGCGAIAPQSTTWLTAAIQAQEEFEAHLWSLEQGGFYNTDARSDLMVRERSFEDNATPAANGVAIANLVRLFLLTENMDYFDRAERALQSFSRIMVEAPSACPSLFAAFDWFQHPILVRTTAEQIERLSQRYFPTVIYRVDEGLPEGVIALVCKGLSCDAPARSLEQLEQQLTIANRV